MSLLLKNVLLEDGYEEVNGVVRTNTVTKDILIEDGKISHIDDCIERDGEVIDAKGQLLLPSLRDMHVHLDKTFFGGDWPAPTIPEQGIFTRIAEEEAILSDLYPTAEERTRLMIDTYIQNGHTHIRTHVNIDPTMELKHLEKTKAVLESYGDQITYEMVAFPQHGLLRNGEAFLKLFEKALTMGVNHVGWVDPANVDLNISQSAPLLFELAEKYNLDIDMHLHDPNTLGLFELHRVLDEIENRQFKQDVTIGHAFCLASISKAELEDITRRLAKHSVDITTSVAMGNIPLTIPLDYLYDHGVQVSLGHDSLIDHWSPFETADTIQKLNFIAKRFNWLDEIKLGQSLKYATGGLTTLNDKGEKLWPNVGDEANVILTDAVSSAHFIARKCLISTVVPKGKVIHQQEINLKGADQG